MSDKLNGMFDNGINPIFEDNHVPMPDYLDKLAEGEDALMEKIDEVTDVPDLEFTANVGLTRASELTKGNNSRDVENKKISVKDYFKEIEKAVTELLARGSNPRQIEKELSRKFPKKQVKRYFESHVESILTKYSKLARNFLENKTALEKVFEEHKNRMIKTPALEVLASFFSWIKNAKNSQGKIDIEGKVAFKRDIDEKNDSVRDIDNNKDKNKKYATIKLLNSIWVDFKQAYTTKPFVKEAHKILISKYNPNDIENFYIKFANDIKKFVSSTNKEAVDFLSIENKDRGTVEIENRKNAYNEKKMFNMAFNLMTQGKTLSEIEKKIKKSFDYQNAVRFLESNKKKLKRHYGQLGYIYIDSNIYDNCDKMAEEFGKINHYGGQLIHAVKSNKICKSCISNKEGTCQKTNLMISNHPLVRSPRAAKRVMDNAKKFVPKAYVEENLKKIDAEDNVEIISNFALGLKNAAKIEAKNIGKKACKEKDSLKTQQTFGEKRTETEVDLFKKSVNSKFIDKLLEEK